MRFSISFIMHGNVWDWVEDDWHEDYIGAPDDGRAWLAEGRSINRVIRGGGWYGGPQRCGSAIRGRFPPGNSDIDLGFRLAATITPGP